MMLKTTLLVCAFTLAFRADALALQIVTPAPGTIVTPGTLVHVVIAAAPGEMITEVAISTGTVANKAIAIDGQPGRFELQVRIPIDAVGPTFIVALATLVGSAAIEYVSVQADPGPLTQLMLSAPPSMTRVGEIFQLDVNGMFDDGVLRPLTQPERGTTYSSTDPTILGVHPSGMIQARSRGSAMVVATNRGRQASVNVVVDVPDPPTNHIPVPDAGPDQIVPPEVVVALSAANSSDPDGDPLQYRWAQQSGPMRALRDDDKVEATFGSPKVLTEQTLVFSLVAIDDKGAVSFPATVRITVRPQ
jgi:hypothetical protein